MSREPNSQSQNAPRPLEEFDRLFEPGDERLLGSLLHDLIGQPCIAWRKSYGRTGSLHYGQLVSRASPPAKAVHKDHGTWVIGLWDCDRRLTFGNGDVIDTREVGDEPLFQKLDELRGAQVEDVRLDPVLLSVAIRHSNQMLLELLPDSSRGPEHEQWAVELPTDNAVIVFGKKRWAIQRNR